LRLRPTGLDRDAVEVIAKRLGRLGGGGLDISADGKRLLVCNSGNRVIVVLKKKR